MGAGGVGPGLLVQGLLHQSGKKQVQMPHHAGLVLHAGTPVGKDALELKTGFFLVFAVMHREIVPERQLGHQFVGAGAVEPHPGVFPGVLAVGGVEDQLVGFGQKQIALLQLVGAAAHFILPFAFEDHVDQVVIPDAGTPGIAVFTQLHTAVEDGELHIFGVVLLEGLFV